MWPLLGIIAAVVAGVFGALLFRRGREERLIEERVEESVDLRSKEWIETTLEETKKADDEEALADFESRFGGSD